MKIYSFCCFKHTHYKYTDDDFIKSLVFIHRTGTTSSWIWASKFNFQISHYSALQFAFTQVLMFAQKGGRYNLHLRKSSCLLFEFNSPRRNHNGKPENWVWNADLKKCLNNIWLASPNHKVSHDSRSKTSIWEVGLNQPFASLSHIKGVFVGKLIKLKVI